MSMRKLKTFAAAAAFAGCAAAAPAETPNLGTPISPADVAPWDISIQPDGSGLPPGSGNYADGAKIFAAKCALCHGADGKGAPVSATPLVGGGPITDISAASKTIANFWPYPTTLFDYIRRAMPWQQPMSLSDQEVYALTAYILASNKLIGETDVIDARTLPQVRMPNRDGFIIRFPDLI
ncbi:MAG: S-disulfanyl-L-cysteine oxidoreductase SoxD [Acetobacteraceae bacterium]|nr:S-disulfanyl-L-cysteine oxidoreductase SoxD [Acetobacteraceae bacterium]